MTPRKSLRKVGFALAASAALVVLVAWLVPRAYLVNDDPGFALYLRAGADAPWMSPVLSWALLSAYKLSPDVAWYGLYLYAVIIATGAVLIHTCIELVGNHSESGQVATRLGALVLCASHIILAIGVTWTTVSISAMGTATAAFVAHLQTCHAAKTRGSPVRAAIYGLLFISGFALRDSGIAAMGAALLPLLVFTAFRFLRTRHLPRPAAVLAFLAPLVLLVAVQGRIPQAGGKEYGEFNALRGKISGAAAFENLDTRAPELLARAGWTIDEYRDFSNWLLADDTEFTIDKVRRLAETGGVPTPIGVGKSLDVLREIATDSPASVWLFLTAIAGGLLLAWLEVIDRRRGAVFSVVYLGLLMAVPVAMAAISRFPQRLSLSFYTVAAFGMFVFLAGEIARQPVRADRPRRGALAVIVISLFMLVWGRNLIGWTKRESWPYHATLREFADRVTARNGIVMVAVGITEMDPLLADPRGYDALPGGWGTFSAPWFTYIERFGIKSGSELLRKMVDNPNAYLVATPHGHATFEEWIRRRLNIPNIRLSLVDSASGMPAQLRSELYRLVTTPLVPGSDEWKLLARGEALANAELPGPPDTADLTFRPIAFSAPYAQHASSLRDPAVATIEPVDGGIRCTGGTTESCAAPGVPTQQAGVRVAVNGLHAARFEVTLIQPENIEGFYVHAQTATDRSARWRWAPDPSSRRLDQPETFTLVPGYPAHLLELASSSAGPHDIRELHLFIAIKPGTHAGFQLRHLEVSEP